MTDLRASLRVISGEPPVVRQRERRIAVTGGKGGVGKSTVAVNLAATYAAGGARTLMVDADFGLADLNLLLGVAPTHSLLDALAGTPIEDVLVAAHGLQLLPALNGSYTLATMGGAARARALELIRSLSHRFDTVVLDVAAGIGASQAAFAAAADDTLIVVDPEPVSMAAAYACLKVLVREHGRRHAYIMPNRVTSAAQADDIVARVTALSEQFLELRLTALPAIPTDPAVSEAAARGVPLVRLHPDAPAARAFARVAGALDALADERAGGARRRRGHLTAQGDAP